MDHLEEVHAAKDVGEMGEIQMDESKAPTRHEI